MAKKTDPLKAKQARQKKIAIVLGVLFLGVVAFQGPKTLKMLKGPQPIPDAVSTATAPAPSSSTSATGTVPAGTPGALPSTPGETPAPAAELIDSDQPVTAAPGQLLSFERFASKDPFKQQVDPTAPAPAPAPAPSDSTGTTTTEEKPDEAASPGNGGSGSAPGAVGRAPAAPAAPELAGATSISVNGVAEDVAVEGSFPKDEPTFVLVKIAPNGKSVELGIAGGEYATGGETIKLGIGKKVTLQNTADGSRYELELLAIQGQPLPKRR